SKPAWRTPTTPSVADRQPIGKTKRTTAACAPRMAPLIDESTEFGARVARRLRDETVVRLTTVTPSGAPLPRPAGFLWDSGTNVFIHNQPGARIHKIRRNPKVALNFDGDGRGGDIVVLSGTAEVDESRPSPAENTAWIAKYASECQRSGMTAGRPVGEVPAVSGPQVGVGLRGNLKVEVEDMSSQL